MNRRRPTRHRRVGIADHPTLVWWNDSILWVAFMRAYEPEIHRSRLQSRDLVRGWAAHNRLLEPSPTRHSPVPLVAETVVYYETAYPGVSASGMPGGIPC
jgi:hypothetical protein